MSEAVNEFNGSVGGKIEILEDGRIFDPNLEALVGKSTDYDPWATWEEKYMDTYYGVRGITPKDIAKQLNRTVASVEGKAGRMGITKRKLEKPNNQTNNI